MQLITYFLTFLSMAMACSETEEYTTFSVGMSEETQSNHLDIDEIPIEAQPPPRWNSRLASKSSSINDWPLEKILSALYKMNVQIPPHSSHKDLFQLHLETTQEQECIPPSEFSAPLPSRQKATQKRKYSSVEHISPHTSKQTKSSASHPQLQP